MTQILEILGRIHHTVDGDGRSMLQRVLTVLCELVTDRGGTDVAVSHEPLADIEQGEPVIITDELDVYVHGEERISVKAVRALVQANPQKRILWVSLDGPTSVAKKEAQSLRVQFMPLKSVCYNITKHCLVPAHTPFTGELSVDTQALPKLPETDPVVAYYGWEVGTVVQITRMWGGGEPVRYLRVVCAAEAS